MSPLEDKAIHKFTKVEVLGLVHAVRARSTAKSGMLFTSYGHPVHIILFDLSNLTSA